ncbi:MAG: hypothetical protein QW147_05535, partial [Candidatus Bathyarchaeia archaeon]
MVKIGLRRLFSGRIRLPLYHLRVYDSVHKGLRLHLRLERDGSGVLIVNASRVLFLNKTAAEYVASFIRGDSEDETVRKMVKRYDI